MKKITLLIISLLLLIYVNACTGYKPIYGTSNFKFKIVDHSIKGNSKLGNKIYSKLYNVSKLSNNDSNLRNIRISINASKEKVATAKNSAGKILEYRVRIKTEIIINDLINNQEILNQSFDYSSSYKVQDQYSETIKLENKIIENLVNKTYQDSLISISESTSKK